MKHIPDTYERIKEEELSDLRSQGTLLLHKKSGARIALLENDDENKVFYIAFRTPPVDSCGTAHIIEHSVLCGSEKYPIKDPFVELAKGSMNTFLNAMTYPDKTVYPIASTNEKDFANLMDVYMDAVLHPNITKHPEIFKQEGWHYELDDPDGEIDISGVVYNEMKGAFSSPEDLLSHTILNSLFPDTAYQYESGGDPDDIPKLSYEKFLEFHAMYYHPCNSYIYLYGDMDMEERLLWLDENYLSKYDRIDIDSSLKKQKSFNEPVRIVQKYPIASGDDEENATYLSYNLVIGDILDAKLAAAFDVLDYALLSSPGAPIRKALVDAGIGMDILGGNDDGTLQPVFSIIAKGTEPEKEKEFLSVIRTVLEEQANGGLALEALLAAINSTEFKVREADFGSYPKGLLYGLDSLDSWLYDENEPFLHLHALDVLASLKEELDGGYFEDLIKRYLLDNKHASIVVIEPQKGLVAENTEKLRKKLADYKNTLSPEEIQKMVEDTEYLHEYQDTPSTQEELLTLPLLERGDLKKKVRPISYEEKAWEGGKCIFCERDTRGVAYADLMFEVHKEEEDISPAIALFTRLVGMVDTAHFSYAELANEVNLHTGGIVIKPMIYSKDDGSYRYFIEANVKYLYNEEEKAFSLLSQMLLSSDFSDKNRLKELLLQEVSGMQMRLMSAGHTLSANRAASYFSMNMKRLDELSGIAYYEYIKDFSENFDDRADGFIKLCEAIAKTMFTRDRLLTCIICEKSRIHKVSEYMFSWLLGLKEKSADGNEIIKAAIRDLNARPHKNEGIGTASLVQYASCAGNFRKEGYEYTGVLKVLRVILNYEYFWLNIRVKGGAYGCMSSFSRNGDLMFSSYRDPNLSETYDIFNATPEYLSSFEISDRDMTKYVIGAISVLDTPLSPSQDGIRSLVAFLTDMTEERLQKERDEILSCNCEDIRRLAPLVKSAIGEGFVCAIGNEDKISSNQNLFSEVRSV